MIFSSVTFLVFFLPAVLVFYYCLPSRKWRNTILLLFSLFFYAWGEPKNIFLMILSIVFNFNMGIFIARKDGRKRKCLLALSVFADFALLFVFKYLGFSCKIFNEILGALHSPVLAKINLALPVGISFYTFQEVSYLVDVYRKSDSAEENILDFALFVSFFPQLVAGPIVRYSSISSQISFRNESVQKFAYGARRFVIGLSKKILLANNFAFICDTIYSSSFSSYGTLISWLACFSYFFQIYFDFSGYSDMAIGLASLFGFSLPENFNYPYAAVSVSDFWRRWHMTLTGFFRDYLYIPLGGNRNGRLKTWRNRMAVFLATGIWHGAAFNFVFWGIFHGILTVLENILGLDKKKSVSCDFAGRGRRVKTVLTAVFRHALTLLFISLLWVLFRNGTKNSVKILLKMFGLDYCILLGGGAVSAGFDSMLILKVLNLKTLAVFFAGIFASFPWWKPVFSEFKKIDSPERILFSKIFFAARDCSLILLLALCFSSLAGESYNPFIYFRF